MKSTDIIANAKRRLKDFIAYEGKEVYLLLNNMTYPNFDNDEEYRISIKDIYDTSRFEIMEYRHLDSGEPYVVGNHYIWEIRITLDDNVLFFDSEDEIEYDYPTVEELGRIADLLEKKYYKLIKNLK